MGLSAFFACCLGATVTDARALSACVLRTVACLMLLQSVAVVSCMQNYDCCATACAKCVIAAYPGMGLVSISLFVGTNFFRQLHMH